MNMWLLTVSVYQTQLGPQRRMSNDSVLVPGVTAPMGRAGCSVPSKMLEVGIS